MQDVRLYEKNQDQTKLISRTRRRSLERFGIRNRSRRIILALSHFGTESRIPPRIKCGAGFFLKTL
jgi:hypothetical protein